MKAPIIEGNVYEVRGPVLWVRESRGRDRTELVYICNPLGSGKDWARLVLQNGAIVDIVPSQDRPAVARPLDQLELFGADLVKLEQYLLKSACDTGLVVLPVDPDELGSWRAALEIEEITRNGITDGVIPTHKMNSFGDFLEANLKEPRELRGAVQILLRVAPPEVVEYYGTKRGGEPLAFRFSRQWLETLGKEAYWAERRRLKGGA